MRRGRVAKKCPEYMRLNILQDLKDTAAQYAYVRMHMERMKHIDAEVNPEKAHGHAMAIFVRSQYLLELIVEMKRKLVGFKNKAKTQCL